MNDASPTKENRERSGIRVHGSSMLSGSANRQRVKIALVTIGIIAILAAAVFVYVNRPVSVQVVAIEHNVSVRVFGFGTVEARVLSKVGFEVGATLVELDADHGDRVAKGQVLARLGAGEQEAKVTKARAARLIAEVNINRAEAGLKKARAVLAQTQEANRRKQSLAGRDIISQQTATQQHRAAAPLVQFFTAAPAGNSSAIDNKVSNLGLAEYDTAA